MNPRSACIRATIGRVIEVMRRLRDAGNSLVVVSTIRR